MCFVLNEIKRFLNFCRRNSRVSLAVCGLWKSPILLKPLCTECDVSSPAKVDTERLNKSSVILLIDGYCILILIFKPKWSNIPL